MGLAIALGEVKPETSYGLKEIIAVIMLLAGISQHGAFAKLISGSPNPTGQFGEMRDRRSEHVRGASWAPPLTSGGGDLL